VLQYYLTMQASNPSALHVSPISCPPAEKPPATLADVLREGAEAERRSLQAYLHTLASREKEKQKRKRAHRKTKRSLASKRKRGEDNLPANSQCSGTVGRSSSTDLSTTRTASTEYIDLNHRMRSRSSDFASEPAFLDFVSPDFFTACHAGYNPTLEAGVPEQSSPEAVFDGLPAAPQFTVFQRGSQPASPIHTQRNHTEIWDQFTGTYCCPDCQVSPVYVPPASANECCAFPEYQQQGSAVAQDQYGSRVSQCSLNDSFAVEEDQVESFLAQFIQWSEHQAAPVPFVPFPSSSLHY
jgi:hypothetical protein